jgi:hypothetical protein
VPLCLKAFFQKNKALTCNTKNLVIVGCGFDNKYFDASAFTNTEASHIEN